MLIRKIQKHSLDSHIVLAPEWELEANARKVFWNGFSTGPLTLKQEKIEKLCRKLLGIPLAGLDKAVNAELKPVTQYNPKAKAMILHSIPADSKAFDADAEAVLTNQLPVDQAAYCEARSVYFGGCDDLFVGRVEAWKHAVSTSGYEGVEIPDIDYYYLSHALLLLAERHIKEPTAQIKRMAGFLNKNKDAIVRIYALSKEMQIFLIWLKRLANLQVLFIDANNPEISRTWNNKSILYPTLNDAQLLKNLRGLTPEQILKEETKLSKLYQELNLALPVLPGYAIKRKGKDCNAFVQQLIQSAQLLQDRYRLQKGCLKASKAGNGARVTPDIDLNDKAKLEMLAMTAYGHNDDYVLEAHVEYINSNIGGFPLKTTPSAHIRWGEVADGLTLQFMEGTRWKGNIFTDLDTCSVFGISAEHGRLIIHTMNQIYHVFKSRELGLSICGIDFAVGRIGGVFGDKVLLAVQDPNFSFNGGECLRIFMQKIKKKFSIPENSPLYAATYVFSPSRDCTLSVLQSAVNKKNKSGRYAEGIASIPGRWGMIGVAADSPADVTEYLAGIYSYLRKKNLIECSTF